jgi:hypothetical protein
MSSQETSSHSRKRARSPPLSGRNVRPRSTVAILPSESTDYMSTSAFYHPAQDTELSSGYYGISTELPLMMFDTETPCTTYSTLAVDSLGYAQTGNISDFARLFVNPYSYPAPPVIETGSSPSMSALAGALVMPAQHPAAWPRGTDGISIGTTASTYVPPVSSRPVVYPNDGTGQSFTFGATQTFSDLAYGDPMLPSMSRCSWPGGCSPDRCLSDDSFPAVSTSPGFLAEETNNVQVPCVKSQKNLPLGKKSLLIVDLHNTSVRERPLNWHHQPIEIRSSAGRPVVVSFAGNRKTEVNKKVAELKLHLSELRPMVLNMIGEEHTLPKQIDRFLGCFTDPRFGLLLSETSIKNIYGKSKALLRSSEQYAPLKGLPDYIRRNWVEDPRFQERIRLLGHELFAIDQGYQLIDKWQMEELVIHPAGNRRNMDSGGT